jgi:hypothetical protein
MLKLLGFLYIKFAAVVLRYLYFLGDYFTFLKVFGISSGRFFEMKNSSLILLAPFLITTL